jgi:AcrR family transcriptional regulator
MSSSRTYRSELRDQQAQHTRAVIAREARARFVAKGWAGTTVRSVAEAAGVSEATVYNVYGSKAGLAVSLIDAAEEAADVRRAATDLVAHDGDPRAQLAAFVGFDRARRGTSSTRGAG